jgi:hypothetical protein
MIDDLGEVEGHSPIGRNIAQLIAREIEDVRRELAADAPEEAELL